MSRCTDDTWAIVGFTLKAESWVHVVKRMMLITIIQFSVFAFWAGGLMRFVRVLAYCR